MKLAKGGSERAKSVLLCKVACGAAPPETTFPSELFTVWPHDVFLSKGNPSESGVTTFQAVLSQ